MLADGWTCILWYHEVPTCFGWGGGVGCLFSSTVISGVLARGDSSLLSLVWFVLSSAGGEVPGMFASLVSSVGSATSSYKQAAGYNKYSSYKQAAGYIKYSSYKQAAGYIKYSSYKQAAGYIKYSSYKHAEGYNKYSSYKQAAGYNKYSSVVYADTWPAIFLYRFSQP